MFTVQPRTRTHRSLRGHTCRAIVGVTATPNRAGGPNCASAHRPPPAPGLLGLTWVGSAVVIAAVALVPRNYLNEVPLLVGIAILADLRLTCGPRLVAVLILEATLGAPFSYPAHA